MYSEHRLGGLSGIDTMAFSSYWKAIKNRIADLQQLPVWTTNHAMKLGIVVTSLRKRGLTDAVMQMEDEIRKVNDDIARAWKVKGYIDKYLPDWVKQDASIAAAGSPLVISPTGVAVPDAATPVPITAPPNLSPSATQFGPMFAPYQEPTITEQFTGWVSSWFGGGGVSGFSPQGLGVLPLAFILAPAAMAALAYVVTTGMSLYQDYVTKKDLTQAVIEGKVTSGQAAEILVASRPPEGLLSQIGVGVGTNIGTMAVLGVVGYLAFIYMTSKKAVS